MKLVKSIVKPEKAVGIKDELQSLGLHGITTKEVRGYGEVKQTIKQVYRGRVFETRADAVGRTEIELIVPDSKVKDVIDTIRTFGSTGRGADGRIYICPIDEAIHVDTGTKHVGASNEEGAKDI